MKSELIKLGGMTNMTYSKKIKQFLSSLVGNYAKYSKLDGCYLVDLISLPESELEEFSSLLIQSDPSLACEATGLDNPDYEESMLPALSLYLQNPTNKDNEIEYLNSWRKGIANYFKKRFVEGIFNELDDYNMEQRIWAA